MTPTETLLGRRILVTRASDQADELVEMLGSRGAKPLSVPVMRLEPLLTPEQFGELGEGIAAGKWDDVVFTSANAVRLVLPRFEGSRPAARIFAIGPGTAAAAAELGWSVESLPESFIAESLAERLLSERMAGRRLLLPRAAEARAVLPDALQRAGAEVEVVALYRMRPEQRSRKQLADVLSEPGLDCVTFASASAVVCFQELAEGRAIPEQVLVACIGPITAEAARLAGMDARLVAREHSLSGLVSALELHLGRLPENERHS
ncbi:MAG: uroporphyrinogen-III synthase [Candidatus Dormiibacterota bacterium]